MAWLFAYGWILIPLAAILVGGFKEWLNFKEKTAHLGTATNELEGEVASLRKALSASEEERQRLIERVQNLETIVTSQVWDVVHNDALPTVEKERALAREQVRLQIPEPEPTEPSAADQAAQLARRMRG